MICLKCGVYPCICAFVSSQAVKFDQDKPRTDLLPVLALEEVTRVFTYGAKKYSDRNWEKGFIWSRPYGATLRHLFAFWRGESIDPESGISHLAHCCCNVLFLLEFSIRKTGTDDRPYRRNNDA